MLYNDFPKMAVQTPNGNEVVITMIHHGSVAVSYNGYEIQVDPVADMDGHTADFASFPKADLILVSHEHGDHLDKEAIQALSKEGTSIICNQGSKASLTSARVFANGDSAVINNDITVCAVPAYNNSEGHTKFHPQGHGNGYVLVIDGLKIYVAGDTEDIPEMSALKGIDVAFLPVNQPYTMTVPQCIKAARMFKPAVLVPYHFSNTDLGSLPSELKADGIEVRIFDNLK